MTPAILDSSMPRSSSSVLCARVNCTEACGATNVKWRRRAGRRAARRELRRLPRSCEAGHGHGECRWPGRRLPVPSVVYYFY